MDGGCLQQFLLLVPAIIGEYFGDGIGDSGCFLFVITINVDVDEAGIAGPAQFDHWSKQSAAIAVFEFWGVALGGPNIVEVEALDDLIHDFFRLDHFEFSWDEIISTVSNSLWRRRHRRRWRGLVHLDTCAAGIHFRQDERDDGGRERNQE